MPPEYFAYFALALILGGAIGYGVTRALMSLRAAH